MNVTYTGRNGELPANLQKKLDARFAKFARLIERRGEQDKEAHVAVSTERHLTKAELTVNYRDHALVGAGSGPDFFIAICDALDRAEKQALRLRSKVRDTKRGPKDKTVDAVPVPPAAPVKAGKRAQAPPADVEESAPQVRRVNHHDKRKPMTLDEAMIAIGERDYLAYRDADRNCVSTLIRRKDGNFDLVES